VITDSIGRQFSIPTAMTSSTANCPTQSAPNQSTVGSTIWVVPGEGGDVTYTICYAQINIDFDFQMDDPDDNTLPYYTQTKYNGTTVIQSIVLPNGKFWLFTYDSADPTDSTSTADGDVVGITMPSGATIEYSYYPPGSVLSPNNIDAARIVHQRKVLDYNGTTLGTWTYLWDYNILHQISADGYTNSVQNPDGSVTSYAFSGDLSCVGSPCVQKTVGPSGETSIATTSRVGASGAGPSVDTLGINTYNASSCPTVDNCFVEWGSLLGPAANGYIIYSETHRQQFAVNSNSVVTTTSYDTLPQGVSITCNYPESGDGTSNPWTGPVPDYCTLYGNTYASTQIPPSLVVNDGGWIVSRPIPTSLTQMSLGLKLSQQTTDYSGAVLSNVSNQYFVQSSPAALSANLLDLPSVSTQYDASGKNIVAETEYYYDDPSQGPGGTKGLLTSKKGLMSPGVWSTAQYFYNSSDGSLSYSVDGNGNKTHIDSYDCNGLIPLSVTTAWQSTSSLPETTITTHDCNTALVTKVQGPNDTANNGNGTRYKYDNVGNLTGISYPDNGSVTIDYNNYAIPLVVSTTTSASPNPAVTKTTSYDGLGRVVKTAISGGGTIDTYYDSSGRVASISNPYYSNLDPTYGQTWFTYDGLGRKTIQKQPDENNLEWCFNGVVSSGQGNCLSSHGGSSSYPWTDYSDETGRHWQQVNDGLGRLTAVVEPSSIASSEATPGTETDYQYDMLGNLINVNQQGKIRQFTYDSLSHLITSKNPETGTICYGQWSNGNCQEGYDANGNLLYKTDANGIVTSYNYDAFNRLLQKITPVAGTDPTKYSVTCYEYDLLPGAPASANLIGHLVAEWTQPGNQCASSYSPSIGALTANVILSYDAMGRVTRSQQCVLTNCNSGIPFKLTQNYDLAGNLIRYTDGLDQMMLTQGFDAAGRLNTVTSSWNNDTFHPPNLFSVQSYNPAGGLQNWTMGNSLNLIRTYDNRLRVTSETVTQP
jgi:YD repeat-containing protein